MAAELQLETLVTRIIAEATQFMSETQKVLDRVLAVNKSFDSIVQHANTARDALGGVTLAMQSLASTIPVIGTQGVAASVQSIVTSLTTLQTSGVANTLKDFGAGLQSLVGSSVGGLSEKLKELGKAFAESGLGKAVVKNAATGLSALSISLGTFRDSVGGLDPGVGGTVEDAINRIGGAISNSSLHLKKTTSVASNLGPLADSLSKLSKIDGTALSSVAKSVGDAITSLDTAISGSKLHLVAVSNVAKNLELLGPVLQSFSGLSLTGMANVRVAIEDLFGGSAMKDLLVDSKIGNAAATNAVNTLNTLAGALRILSRTKLDKIGDVNQTLLDLFDTGKMARILGTSGIAEEGPVAAIMSLRRLATALNVFSKIDLTEATARMTAIATPISGLATGLAGLGPISDVLDKVGTSLKTLARVGTEAFGKRMDVIGTSIRGLTANLSGISTVGLSGTLPDLDKLNIWIASFKDVPPVAIARLSRISLAIAPLGPALNTFAAVNMTAAITNGQQLVKWLTAFNAINPTSVSVISKLGVALSGMANFLTAAGAAGGNLPPIINNISTSAGGAGGPVGRLTSSMGGLSSATMAASGSVRVLKYGLMGLGAVSVAIFARLDDQLTRTLAHIQEINKQPMGLTRPVAESGILGIATSSSTSMYDLARGFDVLTRSGKNASMAIADLRIAESAALSSGMKVEDITKRLSTILGSFGRDFQKPTDHLREFERLADLLTGTAFRSNTTVKDLSEGIGDKVVHAARAAKVSMEDVIAMMGAYARAGTPMSEASDRASRAINELNLRTSENAIRWQLFLGDNNSIRTATGALKSMDQLLEMLSKRFAGLSPEQRGATEKLLGMEMRSIVAIRPLIDQFSHIRELKEDFAGFKGIMQEIARVIRQDFMNQLKTLWNQVSAVAYLIGQSLGPILESFTSTIGVALKAFAGMDPELRNLAIYTVLAAVGFRYLGFYLLVAMGRMAQIPALGLVGFMKQFSAFVGGGLQAGLMGLIFFMTKLSQLLGGIVGGIVRVLKQMTVAFLGWVASLGGSHIFLPLFMFFDGIKLLITGIRSLLQAGAQGILAILGNVFIGILTGLTYLPILLAGIVIALPFISAGLSLVVTSVISFGEVFKHVFGSVSVTWDAMRNRAGKVTKSIAEAFNSAGESIANMWENFKGGAADAFDSVVAGIKVLAGFFWNFRENMKTILDWLRVNWKDVSEDIGRFLVTAIETSVKNIVTLFRFGTSAAGEWISGVWTVIAGYASTAFESIRSQWKNMLDDMGKLLSAFGKAWWHNMNIVPGSDERALWGMRRLYGTEEEVLAKIEKYRENIEIHENVARRLQKAGKPAGAQIRARNEISDLLEVEMQRYQNMTQLGLKIDKKLKGPGDFLKGFEPKTRLDLIGAALSSEGTSASVSLSRAGKAISELWKKTNLLNPFAMSEDTYKAPWQELIDSFNTKGPSGGIMEMINKVLNPTVGSPEAVGGQPGRGGPGYTFKQISESRYMLGGPTAELLDYQQLQTLKSIDDKTRSTAIAANKLVDIFSGGKDELEKRWEEDMRKYPPSEYLPSPITE